MAELEHLNVTVSDPAATAAMLHDIFGWKTRWQGESIYGGETYHVGSEDRYIAVYSKGEPSPIGQTDGSYSHVGGLNHIGVVVDDLDAAEARVKALGLKVGQHHDYEPGRRFYFDDADGIEWEVISYM